MGVYVEQPKGSVVEEQEDKVYLLKKMLYGLKQALRVWYSQIDKCFIEQGFERNKNEPTLYIKNENKDDILVVAFYIDDLVITESNVKLIERFKDETMRRYEINNMGLLYHFFGIEIY